MKLVAQHTESLLGHIAIPPSKSHTIRSVILASLAGGRSRLVNPLQSEDTRAAVNACRCLGARIDLEGPDLLIEGFGSNPVTPPGTIDMLNSGTSTNLMIGVLGALGIPATITGDASLRSRPVKSLVEALGSLGLSAEYLGTKGCPPLRLSGRIRGGTVELDASKSSQYVSSLLVACPLAEGDTQITVKNPTELPYIEMTLRYLDDQQITYQREGFTRFEIKGGQSYKPMEKTIPADWSSAAFPLCAAAVMDSNVLVQGLDPDDVQGDRAILGHLKKMGARISVESDGIRVQGGKPLHGIEIDLNATPDALPALAVVACRAEGRTRLVNVAQARVKETDRIKVMAGELAKMGARIRELPDGLEIEGGPLKGSPVDGHHDHRVVMALSIAALFAPGQTIIDTAESVSVTYPGYVESMESLGATFHLKD